MVMQNGLSWGIALVASGILDRDPGRLPLMLKALREALRPSGAAAEPAAPAPPRIIRTNAPEPPYAGGDGFAYYFEPRLATEMPVDGFPVLIVSGRRVL